MKILLVEDHQLFAGALLGRLQAIADVGGVLHVRSRDEACEVLRTQFIDLLILDLAILEKEGEITPDKRFGHEVFEFAQTNCPGLPTFLLTTSDPDDHLMDLMGEGDRYDIWGEQRDVSAIGYYQKERSIEQLIARVGDVAQSIRELNAISVDTRGRNLGLSEGYLRAIRVFARQRGGVAVEVVPLDGGASRASVLSGRVKNRNDHVIASTVIKLGPRAAIEQETGAFDRHVGNLPNGSFTPKLSTVLKGTCGSGAVVYSLADGFSHSMFSILEKSSSHAGHAVKDVASAMRRWSDAGHIVEEPIAQVRHRLLWDQDFGKAVVAHGLTLEAVEERRVRYRKCCIHADLHGGNILVDDHARPILIDFGEVNDGAAALDPVTLDLSIFFHPDAVRQGLRKAAEPALLHWADIDAYLAAHPFPEFAKACREWAYDVAGGDQPVLVSAYVYLVRQLKFDTVNHALTKQLIEAISRRILAI
jgi:DNA-binding NarL/FixJ family response regulator